ncbi:MAG: hypothetical protein H6Q25_670 [Bacteroidetes bacterium]|nr:hypothetical protein [Bacteroidota bacterium]
MIINSLSFLLFFISVILIYYTFLKEKTVLQNWLIFFASYFFYGMANWKMIPILFLTTVIFFILGQLIQKHKGLPATFYTTFGVILGVGILLYFKYLNFFIQSFTDLLNGMGFQVNFETFAIILPLGISFFTFRLISYIIEINREKIEATTNFITFATYISFFPSLMSGPIDKPNGFIPQLEKKRSFDYNLAVDGTLQIIWGMFKKMVIADHLAHFINPVWNDISQHSGITLILTALLYSIQMYTDFSGYSDMAIGVSKILGFRISKNFNYPFFSRNVAEYWRNWHISLTSWLTDYIFMPLNVKMRNYGNTGLIVAIMINMLVVGLWHGSNWTFALFGFYHGALFIPLILTGSYNSRKKLKTNTWGLASFQDTLRIVGTFLLVTLGLVIFRADSISQFFEFIRGIFNVANPYFHLNSEINKLTPIFIFTTIMFALEWIYRSYEFPLLKIIEIKKSPLKWIFIYGIIMIIILYGKFDQSSFIYFQF